MNVSSSLTGIYANELVVDILYFDQKRFYRVNIHAYIVIFVSVFILNVPFHPKIAFLSLC